jgi:hypothetical protein
MSDTESTAAAPAPTVESALAAAEKAVHDAETAAANHASAAISAAKDYSTIIFNWVNQTLRNSPVAANTEAWNFLHTTGLPDLVKRLKA